MRRIERWDTPAMGHWRRTARQEIERAMRVAEALNASAEETVVAIDQHYPFGSRESYPYTVWLDERRRAMVNLGLLPDPRWIADDTQASRAEQIAAGQLEMFT